MADPTEKPIDAADRDPSGDDPFVPGAAPSPGGEEPPPLTEGEREAVEMAKADPTGDAGPSYERNQDPEDATGGSADPHNTLGHADSGNES
ncbi:MAG: hypothetical protein ACO1SV_20405 [Fimbriimonas sp.]